MNCASLIVNSEDAGKRLDRILVSGFSLSGLRAARRIINDGCVRVNGMAASPGKKLRVGDSVIWQGEKEKGDFSIRAGYIGKKGGFLFFYKPSGMHTVRLAGRNNPNLEAVIGELLPELKDKIILLQRLDHGTSGLVCATRDLLLAKQYREQEKLGKCEKRYWAILEGELEKPVTARNALKVNGKKRVQVLGQEAEELYWTRFFPLWTGRMPGYDKAVTLVDCVLKSGQRHQIRAHASACGYPLAGDPLYGKSEKENFLLEHYAIRNCDLQFAHICPDSAFKRYFTGIISTLPDLEPVSCG